MAQQTIGIGATPNDGTGDPLRTALSKSNDNFTELYGSLAAKAPLASPPFTGTPTAPTAAPGTNTTQLATTAFVNAIVTGLLKLKGDTDASANPNYPAASKGDAYVVTVAGKIGGASGVSVDIGDTYVARIDNAGGTQAAVGASWFVLEHNLAGALLSANNLSDLANAGTARTNLGLGSLATQASGAVSITGGSISGVTDIAVADGGTGASTATAARTNLGLAIGSDVQAFSAALALYAAISPSANVQSLLGAANYAAMRTLLGLVVGTDVQAYDADLQAIAALTSAADKLPYATGAGAWALATLSSFGRSLIDDTNAAAARATLQVSPPIPTGRFMLPDGMQVQSGTAPGVNNIRGYAGWIREPVTITELGARVLTADAAGSFQFGIYAADGATLAPTGSALYSSSNITTAATGSVGVSGMSTSIGPGLYWFFSNTNSATVTFMSNSATGWQASLIGADAAAGMTSGGVARTATFGTWPTLTGSLATDGFANLTNNSAPAIAFKQ